MSDNSIGMAVGVKKREQDTIATLREQVENLTKERDESRKWAGAQAKLINKQDQQLAALAEQNVKAKAVAVSAIKRMRAAHVNCAELTDEVERLLSIPDLASPVLNRIRAGALRDLVTMFRNEGRDEVFVTRIEDEAALVQQRIEALK